MLHIALYKVSKVVKFIEQKVEWWLPEAGVEEETGGGGELLFNKYRVSVLLDEKVLEICCRTM